MNTYFRLGSGAEDTLGFSVYLGIVACAFSKLTCVDGVEYA